MTAEMLTMHRRSLWDLFTFARHFEVAFPTSMTPETAAEEVYLLNDSVAGERHPHLHWRTVTTRELTSGQ